MKLIDMENLIGNIRYEFNDLADSWIEASEKIIDMIREEEVIEIPDEHGDLIDRDKFSVIGYTRISEDYENGILEMVKKIDDAPIVIPAKVGADTRGDKVEGVVEYPQVEGVTPTVVKAGDAE